jgi:hypothetical protein
MLPVSHSPPTLRCPQAVSRYDLSMDDWEHPEGAALQATGLDENGASLEQRLSEALDRISALEQRVKRLEDAGKSTKKKP